MKIKTLFICMLILGVDANAKLSSNKIEKQKDKIQNIIDVCQFDDSVLKEIKGKTTGSIVTSSIATAASVVSTAASVGALVIGKDNKSVETSDNKTVETADNETVETADNETVETADNETVETADNKSVETADNKKKKPTEAEINAKLKTHRVASAIGSGIATGANLVTVTLSGPSLNKVQEQIQISEDCQKAINEFDTSSLTSTN